MAEEGAAQPTEGGEAAAEQPAAEAAPAAEPEAASEAPSEAPSEATAEPAAEGEAGGEGGEETGEGGGAFAEGEEAPGGGEEGGPGGEVAIGEGDEGGDARPPSEAEEGAEEAAEEEDLSMKPSRIGLEGKPSVSVLEEQRKARLEKYGSRAKVALGSVIDIRYGAAGVDGGDRKVARFLNSYKLDSDKPFNPELVNPILETVIKEALEELTYDTDKCPKQAKWATSAIRAKIKEMEFDRYKIVCVVTIGEKMGQDVLVTCRFLWDYDRDRYTTFSMENTHVYATAQCFGLYYE